MNLLKVFIAVVIAASLSLLYFDSALAVDHPWDDNKCDTTTTVGTVHQQGNPKPSDTSIIARISDWTRLFFLEIKSVLIGELKGEVGTNPPAGRGRKSSFPIDNKK
jgi:hypothetical protein